MKSEHAAAVVVGVIVAAIVLAFLIGDLVWR